MPSTSRLANASASAWPQSIPPSLDRLEPPVSWRLSFGWTVKWSGVGEQLRVELAQPVGPTAVTTSEPFVGGVRSLGAWPARRTTPSASRAPGEGALDVRHKRVRLLLGDDALVDQLRRVLLPDAGCSSIRSTISGCV